MRPTALLTPLLLSLAAAPTVVAVASEDGRASGPSVSSQDLLGADPAAHASGGGQLLGLAKPSSRPAPRVDADSKDAVQKCGAAFVVCLGALWFPVPTLANMGFFANCALALPCLFADCAGDGT
ncbi:hypothetical protein [Nannocystis pusilla]|uniref:hypothetical protein n=1 Tax=Nannocystis pusilla TaxID=889268 RepID=UPI003DA66D45